MIYDENSVLADIYSNILTEDVQSSLNQARNILKNNGVTDYENVLFKLQNIYNRMEENPEYAKINKDTNIPALAYWYLADSNIERISQDYSQYLSTPSLNRKNFLINSIEELKHTISAKKLFKPSDEKSKLIRNSINKIAETIHVNYVPPKNESNLEKISNDDVVYEDDVITIYRADSKDKCIKYGSGSSLCISTKGGGNYYWSYRMGNMRDDDLGMTTYFVYWKDGSNRILIDALGDEDGPANKYSWNPINTNIDRDISPESLIQKYPILSRPFAKNIFQFLPYGEKEERFAYIDDHVDNVRDSKLKTFDDYDIYIECGKKIGSEDFENYLESKLSFNEVSFLYKKYIWRLNKRADRKLVLKYLSNGDVLKYDELIKRKSSKKQLRYISTFGEFPEEWVLDILSKNQDDIEIKELVVYAWVNVEVESEFREFRQFRQLTSKLRKFFKNNTIEIEDSYGKKVYAFDSEGYLTEIDAYSRNEWESSQFDRDGNLLSYTDNDGDIAHYTADGYRIGGGDLINNYYTTYGNDGSITYFDSNYEPVYKKYKDGTVEYYDDTDSFLNNLRNRKYRRTRLKKESVDLTYLCNRISILFDM